MSGHATGDIVMKFVFKGKPVWAECALEIDPDDTMMKDFGQNVGYDNYADFFEVSGFDFGISLKESDANKSGNNTLNQSSRPAPPGQQPQKPKSMPYAKWRSATGDTYKDIHFPLEFDEFNFERTIDAASTTFFQNCCTSQAFDSATMVKRVSQGETGLTDAKSRAQRGYLRIDFEKVLITSMSWDDGDVVKEKCSFICQKMTIKYRPQAFSGVVDSKGEVSMVWPDPRGKDILNGGRP